MVTYEEELLKKNDSLKEIIKKSKEELESLKDEFNNICANTILSSNNSIIANSSYISTDSFSISKIYNPINIYEDSLPIKLHMNNDKIIEITIEDIIKLKTLLNKKTWYKRAWELIQKIWKKETKS